MKEKRKASFIAKNNGRTLKDPLPAFVEDAFICSKAFACDKESGALSVNFDVSDEKAVRNAAWRMACLAQKPVAIAVGGVVTDGEGGQTVRGFVVATPNDGGAIIGGWWCDSLERKFASSNLHYGIRFFGDIGNECISILHECILDGTYGRTRARSGASAAVRYCFERVLCPESISRFAIRGTIWIDCKIES